MTLLVIIAVVAAWGDARRQIQTRATVDGLEAAVLENRRLFTEQNEAAEATRDELARKIDACFAAATQPGAAHASEGEASPATRAKEGE